MGLLMTGHCAVAERAVMIIDVGAAELAMDSQTPMQRYRDQRLRVSAQRVTSKSKLLALELLQVCSRGLRVDSGGI